VAGSMRGTRAVLAPPFSPGDASDSNASGPVWEWLSKTRNPLGGLYDENQPIRNAVSVFDDGSRSDERLSRGRAGPGRALARDNHATSTINSGTERTSENCSGQHRALQRCVGGRAGG